ncbi:hydrogenase expression/formation protein HypE [Methylacidiphilum caldifontis]|uniref:Hydrogenase expression/formation protein HypE n=1 Tax=Methylacidiphilum caldifontis TaxID=2795386 RepID=A0A4Y8PFQ6_9BACT|nr:hydrogenase expression/formation protein HypE [Methylacidiphilum caldifontis]TFE70715.1 hydrogenase expression/formation protein HypE [Methylacidiphilum caldifontis]
MNSEQLGQQIELAHGSGGKSTYRLIRSAILPALKNPILESLSDAAVVDYGAGRIALTTDSFVVHPLMFSGGSIGKLAINGTVNDLAVSGAQPRAILLSLIVEAGLPMDVFLREIQAIAEASRIATVPVIGGDTKVVEHGKGDGLYITTTGLGIVDPKVNLSPQRIKPGDQVIVSGPIGDHGIAILLARGEIELEANLRSDSRPLWPLIKAMISVHPSAVKWMRDPTRGGVATTLNELSREIKMGVVLFEEMIPLREEVRGACEILGLDPLHIACEGQFVAIVEKDLLLEILKELRKVPGGEEATHIGEIREQPAGVVLAVSSYGGSRRVDMLIGDPLPRIC